MSRFWTLCPVQLRTRPKAHLCMWRGDMILWRGTALGGNMTRHWERIRGYGWKRWPPCPLSLADCMQLWAPLWTCLFAYVWQEHQEAEQAKRSGPPFKMEAKGQASKHPVLADTYPYIISTTIQTMAVAKGRKIGLLFQNQHVNVNRSQNVCELCFGGWWGHDTLMS